MKPRFTLQTHRRTVTALLGFLGVALALFSPRAFPASETATNGPAQTAGLDYAEMDFSMTSLSLDISTQSEPFKREPARLSGNVMRGLFILNPKSTNSIAFLWDRTSGRLYLDLNGNRDLTDDTAGVFSCQTTPPGDNHQSFNGVRLPFKTPVGNRHILADIYMYSYSGGGLNCSASLRSMWKGKLVMHGREWQVGIVESFHGRYGVEESKCLLLRPWEKRNESFTVFNSKDAFPFPSLLFFDNHACRVDIANEPLDNTSRFVVRFAGQQPVLGEMNITGKDIQRMRLQADGAYLVILDQPGSVVKLPVGSYQPYQSTIWLGKGNVSASSTFGSARGIDITDKKPATLVAGSPLTNSVSVSRRGSSLSLNYKLVGVGGETYTLESQDRSKPPEFEIVSNGRKIASGKFQYG